MTNPDGNGVLASVRVAGTAAPRGSVDTDSDGNYTIVGLAPGNYRTRVTPQAASLRSGWYSASTPGHFVTAKADATQVHVGP